MKQPLLHLWLGAYMTKHYKIVHSGQYKTFRVHPFFVQDSGSGKSVGSKATFFLTQKLGLNVEFLSTITDKCVVGGIWENSKTGEETPKYGQLQKCDILFWDEATSLLNGGDYNNHWHIILQMATDDPGFITKGVGTSILKYKTEVSISFTSYPDDSIDKTILHKGLFQRMWLVFHDRKAKELFDYFEHKADLVNVDFQKRENLQLKIRDFLNEKLKDRGRTILVNHNDYKKFMQDFVVYIKERMEKDSFKDRKQKILLSFIARNDVIINIAGQRAIMSGKKEIDYEDLLYGFSCYKKHLGSVIDFLMEGELMEQNMEERRKDKVLALLKQQPNIGMVDLRNLLIKLPRDQWDLRETTTDRFLRKMKEDGILNYTIKKHGKKELFL